MTTRVLTGAYPAGYTIASGITTLSLTSTAYVGGTGVATAYGATGAYSVTNHGRIFETYGASDPHRAAGVYLGQGGSVTNGGRNDTQALIEGYRGVFIGSAPGTVKNFGTIIGDYRSGVFLSSSLPGGRVVNGSEADTTALIEGGAYSVGVGVSVGGRVRNFATIRGSDGVQGVANGISLTNGSLTDTTALIAGGATGAGVILFYDSRVRNFATISGRDGVDIASGVVTNGSPLDNEALISGSYYGVLFGDGKLVNHGTILGQSDHGVQCLGRGVVANGSPGDPNALIEGTTGVYFANRLAGAGSDRLVNYGTIEGTGGVGQAGVSVEAGAVATVTNFGLISGAGGVALDFNSSADVLIVEAGCSFQGAVTGDGGTLELASGTGTVAIRPADGRITVSGSMAPATFKDFGVLRIDAGASFASTGAVAIAGGQIVSDAGSLVLGSSRGSRIANAGLVEAADGGDITLNGVLVNAGTILADGGTIIADADISGGGVLEASAGTLTLRGAVADSEQAVIAGGTLDFATFFDGPVTFTRAGGQLGLAQSQSYRLPIFGFSNKGASSLDLGDIGFVSPNEATYAKLSKGFGLLTVTDGTRTANLFLVGAFSRSTFTTASDGHGGVIVVASLSPPVAASHAFIAAMATLAPSAAAPLHQADAARPSGGSLLAPNRHAMIA